MNKDFDLSELGKAKAKAKYELHVSIGDVTEFAKQLASKDYDTLAEFEQIISDLNFAYAEYKKQSSILEVLRDIEGGD